MDINDLPYRGHRSIYKPTLIAGIAAIFTIFALQKSGCIPTPHRTDAPNTTEQVDSLPKPPAPDAASHAFHVRP